MTIVRMIPSMTPNRDSSGNNVIYPLAYATRELRSSSLCCRGPVASTINMQFSASPVAVRCSAVHVATLGHTGPLQALARGAASGHSVDDGRGSVGTSHKADPRLRAPPYPKGVGFPVTEVFEDMSDNHPRFSPTAVPSLTSPPAEAGRFFAFYTGCSGPVGPLVLRLLRELH